MVSAHDVAAYVLERLGPMSAMKLQKLVYYAQAWHLAWLRTPLYPEPIEAWAKGPVVRALYDVHRGYFTVGRWPVGSSRNIQGEDRDAIDRVLDFYGKRDAEWLSALTHREDPWKDARKGLSDGQYGDREITTDSLMKYYGSR